MKKHWLRYLALFGFVVLSGTLLLQTSQDVQHAEDEMHVIKSAVDAEKESIRILHAEWDYLNNPERLEALAAQYLELVAPVPGLLIADPASLPEESPIPSENPVMQISAQPAVLSSSALPQILPVVKPSIKPALKPAAPRQDFNDLLQRVQNGGAE